MLTLCHRPSDNPLELVPEQPLNWQRPSFLMIPVGEVPVRTWEPPKRLSEGPWVAKDYLACIEWASESQQINLEPLYDPYSCRRKTPYSCSFFTSLVPWPGSSSCWVYRRLSKNPRSFHKVLELPEALKSLCGQLVGLLTHSIPAWRSWTYSGKVHGDNPESSSAPWWSSAPSARAPRLVVNPGRPPRFVYPGRPPRLTTSIVHPVSLQVHDCHRCWIY